MAPLFAAKVMTYFGIPVGPTWALFMGPIRESYGLIINLLTWTMSAPHIIFGVLGSYLMTHWKMCIVLSHPLNPCTDNAIPPVIVIDISV